MSKTTNLYLSIYFRYVRIHTSSVCSNALHVFTLKKTAVARFLDTNFLIRYLYTYKQFKKSPRLYLTKHYCFSLKIELQCSHYRKWIHRSRWELVVGIRGAHYGNHCSEVSVDCAGNFRESLKAPALQVFCSINANVLKCFSHKGDPT